MGRVKELMMDNQDKEFAIKNKTSKPQNLKNVRQNLKNVRMERQTEKDELHRLRLQANPPWTSSIK